ncbi:hypothetical protein BV20DRAFT_997262 [Pilatotrama ljubarskyi]|nr:hypothetical protein BV20DRAFT_997262 [Pilatotrama ljubarskyi]
MNLGPQATNRASALQAHNVSGSTIVMLVPLSIKSMPLFAVLLATAIPSALADFHIFNGANGSGGFAAKTVPSNQYSCAGWQSAPVVDGVPDVDSGTSAFSVRNLCGVSQLNFYNNGNGFDVYINNGNGQKIGTCGPGNDQSINGGSACPDGYAVFDAWICLTYVCS